MTTSIQHRDGIFAANFTGPSGHVFYGPTSDQPGGRIGTGVAYAAFNIMPPSKDGSSPSLYRLTDVTPACTKEL
eukprot:CAMPEP_0202446872 /NCGR_PEP_ID=MMETSP1360-20130828/5458_1 /ASSEMBLY_ACC=CAM_ASM_000848 /TAXON_ID=515479 /ORGANISM="Licmophora paradoxa, Strain CCMP2313" /LENGTH=73 /DNA_ID=CAMNT_0049063603 /DNA_START=1 /DNA_END=219 /DNA_ORIENTATION=+